MGLGKPEPGALKPYTEAHRGVGRHGCGEKGYRDGPDSSSSRRPNRFRRDGREVADCDRGNKQRNEKHLNEQQFLTLGKNEHETLLLRSTR